MKIFKDDDMLVPVLSWCENPDSNAIEQAKAIAKLPFVYSRVCLMPDVHLGYALPVGGVVALKGVISSNFVGVDIGCGMTAVQTSCQEIDTDRLKKIMGEVRKAIPVGFNHHKQPQAKPEDVMPILGPIVNQEKDLAMQSLGTLGGGNHFIEFQKDEDGFMWIMLHSGSRNLGKKICDYYHGLAQELTKKWYSKIPSPDLAFLPLDTDEGVAYQNEMTSALQFAYQNRMLMINRIMAITNEELACGFSEIVNIHHNYAKLENHEGHNLVVHRKGATSAREGEIGIIPGSQGTASYIVRGKGNPKSFMSCSHGSGRRLGRREACRVLDLKAEKELLDSKGIIHGIRGSRDLEEAAGAYKSIDVVMAEQQDLVDIVHKLEPIGVIKG